MTQRPDRIVLTAGGTGGHVFPAEALAGELMSRGYELILVTDRRGAAYKGHLGEIETYYVRAAAVAGRDFLRRTAALLKLGLGTLESVRLMRRLEPAAAVGFGGYAAVPAMLAASRTGVRTIIHEQNAVLGRANRLLAARAECIATSFDTVYSVPPDEAHKVVHIGNPVRAAIALVGERPYPRLNGEEPLSILVTGGSQGAHNFSSVVPAAVALLPDGLRARLRISQQCRPDDLHTVRDAYAGMGVEATLESFFTDMPERLAGAHLVICRAGASTLAELSTLR